MSTKDKIKERRLDRMRLGQAVCDFVELPSDPEIRVAVVPLVEADYRKALEKVGLLRTTDDLAGMQIKDRAQAEEILVQAIREADDLTQRVYASVEELNESVEVGDIDHLIDCYNEMVFRSSPSIEGISPEEFDALKKTLQAMDWNALSGSAWYAAKRFLSRITPSPLLDNSRGSSSIKSLTTKSDEEKSTSDV